MGSSPYPIYGLAHRVSIRRETEQDSGYGSVVAGTPTSLYTNVRCRIGTFRSTEDNTQQYLQGRDARKVWHILSKYLPNVAFNDTAVIGSGTPAPAGNYGIFFYKHEIDQNGKFHSTRLWVEQQ